MCRFLKVTLSAHDVWQVRPASARQIDNTCLLGRIRQMYADSQGALVAPRMHEDLRDEGEI